MSLRLVGGCFVLGSILLGCGGGGSSDEGSGGAGGTAGGAGAAGSAMGSGGGAATGGGSGAAGTGGGFTPPSYGTWEQYEPDGARCSDGSQYKFYVSFSESSDDVVIFFEGGGACWDYDSCSGTGSIRGAANPNGLVDDYASNVVQIAGMSIGAESVYPLLNGDPAVSPMADWNKVFVPYCTGDVYSGTHTQVYEDPDGAEPDLEFHHVGHLNVLAMTEMLSEMFASIPQMFVSGCSAGGAGAIINYYFLRSGLPVQRGYLLDDSGPMFPDAAPTSRSRPLHDEVRSVWNADQIIDSGPNPDELRADFGNMNTVLAAEFPDDRLAVTLFRLDYNYSLYSYERFWDRTAAGDIVPYTGTGVGLDENDRLDRSAVHSLWWDDIALLRAQYDDVSNLGYYIPFYRKTNGSHCVTIPGIEEFDIAEALRLFGEDFSTLAWKGSEIGGESIRTYVDHLLDDSQPLESHFEEDGEGPFVPCTPASFDEAACLASQP